MEQLRRKLALSQLNETKIDPDPFKQFDLWFQQARAAELAQPTAMALATANKLGIPSVRIVLLKAFDQNGFIFFTNYESQKGKELAENPAGALVSYWAELGRQIRIVGVVNRISDSQSEAYFKSRNRESCLAAWASQQSQAIASREKLEQKFKDLKDKYQGQEVPLPPFWGGFCLSPSNIEFWQSRPNRLHDRLRYFLQPDGSWKIERLAP